MPARTPVVLITGTLGSGKTTLLRRVLDDSGRRFAVLMNEFGEIAIDSKIIRGAAVDIVELAGGCVCCSLTGEFEAAVREIIERVAPEAILVEATGVAESDALAFEVEDNLPEVRLDTVVCIVDAYVASRFPRIGYTERTQLATADFLLINKTDLVTEDELRALEAEVKKYNSRAAMIRTRGCDIDTGLLFGAGGGVRPRTGGVRLAGERLESFVWSGGGRLQREAFETIVQELPEAVFRAKGYVRLEDGDYLFNYVAGRVDFEAAEASGTELVFIGRRLLAEREEVTDRLEKARLNDVL